MAVMRSVLYVPGNSEKMIGKAASIPADIVTLDLEDSVPASEKEAARTIVGGRILSAGAGGSDVYVRINDWETPWTNGDLEAVVVAGLHGVTLAKCRHPRDVDPAGVEARGTRGSPRHADRQRQDIGASRDGKGRDQRLRVLLLRAREW